MLRVAAVHPAVVRKLVLWSVAVKAPAAFANKRWAVLRGLIDTDFVLFTEAFSQSLRGWSGDEGHEWARLTRRSVGPEDAALVMDAVAAIDWSSWLPRIQAQTLVLRQAGANDPADGTWADVPDVRLVDLRDAASPHRNEAGQRAVEEFLSDGQPTQAPVPVTPKVDAHSDTAIILFADIVDSTALTERLGDAAFREKARELDGALRTIIREHAGTPIEGKLLGDGVLAVFTSARQAIEAALACGKAGDEGGLPLHLGVHAGDVIRESDPDGRANVYGGAVNIASRISGLSAPGEVLVSETVRSLARTSAGVTFEDRGEQTLKGVGEPVRVWAVEERA